MPWCTILDNFMVTAQIHKVTLVTCKVTSMVSIYNCKLPVHCLQLLPCWEEGAYKILWKHSSPVSQQQCWSYRKSWERFNLLYHRQNRNKQHNTHKCYNMKETRVMLQCFFLHVPGMHRMITTEGVPLLPSSFLQLIKFSSQSMRKYKCVTNCL